MGRSVLPALTIICRPDRVSDAFPDPTAEVAWVESRRSPETTGRFIGPRGQEAVKTAKGDRLAYYYDGYAAGGAKLQFSRFIWSADGRPELGPLPKARIAQRR